MTLGFAAASWSDNDERLLCVASDTRISSASGTLTDAGLKTYELGGRCALAAAGHALPPMMAAEVTRSFIESHNRLTPERRVGFFDTVRLFSFFLRRAAIEQSANSEVVVAGFLSDRTPCLARVVVSPALNRVSFTKVEKGDAIVMAVGDRSAARLLIESIAEAKRVHRPRVVAAIGMLYYTAKHQGAFRSIGGGISVGTCSESSEAFSWPIIKIENCMFMRGMDVSAHYRSSWPPPEMIEYDEDWCARQDKELVEAEPPDFSIRHLFNGFNIDSIVAAPETLFETHFDPEL